MQQAAILEAFAELPDPRRKAGQRHSISLCLALFTLAIAAGNRGFLAIGDWIDAYQSELIELLGVDKQRLPSYSTIRRVLLQLDYQKYAQCVVNFLGLQNVNEERIAVYSKALQKYAQPDNSNFNIEPHPAINLVSSFLAERGLMLETSEVDPRPYGIKGLPETIKTMALKGVSFALEAIRVQPKTNPDS